MSETSVKEWGQRDAGETPDSPGNQAVGVESVIEEVVRHLDQHYQSNETDQTVQTGIHTPPRPSTPAK